MLLHKDFEVPTCRRRLLEVLSFADEEGPASALQGGSDDDETSSDVIQDLPGESTSERDFLDALERLAALYGEGFLTADEFRRAKARLLWAARVLSLPSAAVPMAGGQARACRLAAGPLDSVQVEDTTR